VSNAHLANAFAYRLHVPRIALREPFDTVDDLGDRPLIPESRKPLIEFIGFPNVYHCIL
jgi:hypothetical protein